ncbi:hypothetical protein [Streptomyces sp. NPDC002994]|uniref:hypothetical protein n=1 Tax=Streptomyces sp. NPDC002994 TaxID=3154441 RepID=UPI0033B303DA
MRCTCAGVFAPGLGDAASGVVYGARGDRAGAGASTPAGTAPHSEDVLTGRVVAFEEQRAPAAGR